MNSHMPFVNAKPFGLEMVLCICPEGSKTWQVHARRDDSYHRLDTGMPAGIVECSPTFFVYEQELRLSFVAGGHPELRDWQPYRLYQRRFNADLEPIAPAAFFSRTMAGFVSPEGYGFLHYVRTGAQITLVRDGQPTRWLAPNAKIYRLSYHPQQPWLLLISGAIHGGAEFALRLDTRTDEQALVLCDGVPGYKHCEYEGVVHYAQRGGPSFEARRVVRAMTVDTIPTTLLVRESETP